MKPILVIAHVHYRDKWPEVAAALRNIAPYKHDIIVTVTGEVDDFSKRIKKGFPKAKIIFMPNHPNAFDVVPFLIAVRNVDLDKYSYLVKLHTKRDTPADHKLCNGLLDTGGAKWREMLMKFASTRNAFKQSIEYLESHPKVGILAGDYRIIDPFSHCSMRRIRAFMRERDIKKRCSFSYVAGTMFIARAEIFEMFKMFKVTLNNPQTPYVLERMFGYAAYANGYKIDDVNASRWKMRWWYFRVWLRRVSGVKK